MEIRTHGNVYWQVCAVFFSCFNKRQSMEMKGANTMFVHSKILIFLELISWVGSKVNLSCANVLDKAVRDPSLVPFEEWVFMSCVGPFMFAAAPMGQQANENVPMR